MVAVTLQVALQPPSTPALPLHVVADLIGVKSVNACFCLYLCATSFLLCGDDLSKC